MPETPQSMLAITADRGFSYGGVEIPGDSGNRYSLTAMWRAVGCPAGREPKNWRRFEGARFMANLAAREKVSVAHLFETTRGRNGQTWGHWQAALAYAQYLDPEFHRFVNEKFREWFREEINPDLKADRAITAYRLRGMSDQDIMARLEGKVARHVLTDALKEAGCTSRLAYAAATDSINQTVLGGTAAEIRRERGIAKSAPTRDHLAGSELAAVRLAEHLAAERIVREGTRGEVACVRTCRRAGEAVGAALSQFRSTTGPGE